MPPSTDLPLLVEPTLDLSSPISSPLPPLPARRGSDDATLNSSDEKRPIGCWRFMSISIALAGMQFICKSFPQATLILGQGLWSWRK